MIGLAVAGLPLMMVLVMLGVFTGLVPLPKVVGVLVPHGPRPLVLLALAVGPLGVAHAHAITVAVQ